MATPPMVPAGWYADPAGRHEYRYWDGTGWTPGVADRGITATDPLEAPPPVQQVQAEPPAQQVHAQAPVARQVPAQAPLVPPLPAETSPAAAAAAPPSVRRGQRRWAVPAGVAIVVVLGLAAGLVIWAPWKSPPLLRPTGLTAGPVTTSSLAFHWSKPATGPDPDKYLILHDGKVIGSVPGTVTSYQTTGLAPDTAYQYRVAAERGGQRSALSAVVVVHTAIPPVSAARLQGTWAVKIKIIKGRSSINGAKKWAETWLANPKCTTGPCTVRLAAALNGHTFKVTLARAGAVYRGKTHADVFPCGSGSTSFPIRSALTVRVALRTAQVDNGAWTASSWAGTLAISSPYTASGNYYCPASQQTASLVGGF